MKLSRLVDGFLILLFAAIIPSKLIAAECLVSSGAGKLECPAKPVETLKAEDPIGLYHFYRFINKGEGQRKCRLQPTCSLFALQGAREFGIGRGLLYGFARAQMEHSAQGGHLERTIGSDGYFLYLDPLTNWIK